MPKLIEVFGFRFFFWSNEGKPLEPIHVHVSKGSGSKNATKFWILQSGEALLDSNGSGFTSKELNRIKDIIEQYSDSFEEKWKNYFGEEPKYYKNN